MLAAQKEHAYERKAIDVLWGTTSAQGRVDMIQRAIDAGFTGIGCYENFMHVDIGTKRQWGPTAAERANLHNISLYYQLMALLYKSLDNTLFLCYSIYII